MPLAPQGTAGRQGTQRLGRADYPLHVCREADDIRRPPGIGAAISGIVAPTLQTALRGDGTSIPFEGADPGHCLHFTGLHSAHRHHRQQSEHLEASCSPKKHTKYAVHEYGLPSELKQTSP